MKNIFLILGFLGFLFPTITLTGCNTCRTEITGTIIEINESTVLIEDEIGEQFIISIINLKKERDLIDLKLGEIAYIPYNCKVEEGIPKTIKRPFDIGLKDFTSLNVTVLENNTSNLKVQLDNGNILSINIYSKTKLFDNQGKPITIENIQEGQKVQIFSYYNNYTDAEVTHIIQVQ